MVAREERWCTYYIGRCVQSRSEDLGNSPRAFRPEALRASELRAWDGHQAGQSEPMSGVEQTSVDWRLGLRGGGGWVRKQGAGEAIGAK